MIGYINVAIIEAEHAVAVARKKRAQPEVVELLLAAAKLLREAKGIELARRDSGA